MSLSDDALKIWNQLSGNDRSQSATTIAVIKDHDGNRYCTSNDVNKIPSAAVNKAKELGISKIGENYIDQAGAGFHAEMWAVVQALHNDEKPSDVIESIGASRACCKYCSAVLALLEIKAEQTSDDLYGSWYNPLTCGEDCKPRSNYRDLQRADIPDFRNRGKDYWFSSADGNRYREHF